MVYQEKNGSEYPIGITAIIGPEGCGDEVLLEGLSKTIGHSRGFAFESMNRLVSSLKGYEGEMDDALLITGFYDALRNHQAMLKESHFDGSFRHLVISGFPQNDIHLGVLLEICQDLRLAYIDVPNKKCHPTHVLASDFERTHPTEQFISVNPLKSLHYQAEHIVKNMDITAEESQQIRHMIFAKRSSAHDYFEEASHQDHRQARHEIPTARTTQRPTVAALPRTNPFSLVREQVAY